MLKPIKNHFLDKMVAAKLFLLKQEYPITDFLAKMKRVKKILIILPSNGRQEPAVQEFMNKLNQAFTTAEVSTFETSLLRKNDVNWLGVPKKEYLNKIREEQFDLLIDLNSEQDRVCAYLGALSNAPMRIHLSEGRFDKIYNLFIRTDDTAPLDIRYDSLFTHLAKLRKATHTTL